MRRVTGRPQRRSLRYRIVRLKETRMAKGQLRSNREKKKPKQAKKPAPVPASARPSPGRDAASMYDKKK